MVNELDEIHQILDDLASKIKRRGQVLTKEKSSTYGDNLRLSEWEREQAYCWIHATDLYLPLMVRSKEDFVHQIDMDGNGNLIHQKVRILKPAINSIHYGNLMLESSPPDLLSDMARLWYNEWFKGAGDIKRPKIIKYPEPEENVYEYLHCLSRLALKKHSSKWRESLGSFVYFLRHQIHIDERQKINEMFPEHMKISRKSISRLIPNTAQPIDIKMAAEVIQGLIARIRGVPMRGRQQRKLLEWRGYV